VDQYFKREDQQENKDDDPNRFRGLTTIKNILLDFENDSDFMVSQRERAEDVVEDDDLPSDEGIAMPSKNPTIIGGSKGPARPAPNRRNRAKKTGLTE